MQRHPPLDPRKTQKIIWLALMASTIGYGVIFYLFSRGKEALEVPEAQVPVFGMLAFLVGTATFLLPRLMKGSLKSQGPQAALTLNILKWALSEMVAVIGLAMAFPSNRFELFLPFAGASLVLLFIHRPKEEATVGIRRPPDFQA